MPEVAEARQYLLEDLKRKPSAFMQRLETVDTRTLSGIPASVRDSELSLAAVACLLATGSCAEDQLYWHAQFFRDWLVLALMGCRLPAAVIRMFCTKVRT
jgi:hypothetical protein